MCMVAKWIRVDVQWLILHVNLIGLEGSQMLGQIL
jgi:hypothetical protein